MFSWTTDICTVRGLSIEESRLSTECTDHMFFLAAAQGGDFSTEQANGTFLLWL